MSRLRRQLEEDRALRNSAWSLLRKEFDHVRKDIAPQALGERVADNVGERLELASDSAIGFAGRHGKALAAAGAAIASAAGLWLARRPLFGGQETDDGDAMIADGREDKDQEDE
jgi:hypothetical protein